MSKKTNLRRVLRIIFQYILDILFSNDRAALKQIKLANRHQLVWISEGGSRRIALRIFERRETKFIENWIQAGFVCVDVGANVGYYTQLLASLVGETGRVLAIEPIPRNASLVNLNNYINCKEDVIEVMNVAVGEKEKADIEFAVPSSTSSFASIFNKADRPKASYALKEEKSSLIKVPLRTLDNVIEQAGILKVDFLKIDVEGYELMALKGMVSTLGSETAKPQLIMLELNSEHLHYYENTIDDVVGLLASFGYAPRYLDSNRLVEGDEDRLGKEQNIFFIPT